MFWDAAVLRKIIYPKNRGDPLTEEEIYAATRIQYRIDTEQDQELNVKKTRPHCGKYR
jgi:hypothetical protein